MKAMTKIISACLVVLTLMMALVSCGLSAADVAGSYYCEYEYNGNKFQVTIILDQEINYTKNTVKNGIHSTVVGKYEIGDNEISLISSVDSSAKIVYTYSDGVLTNNGRDFVKAN